MGEGTRRTAESRLRKWLWTIGFLAIVLFFLMQRGGSAADGSDKARHLKLTLTYTGLTWYGKPVYELWNGSESALTRLTLYSWSNEMLPPLYIGSSPPVNLTSVPPLAHPPYNVPAGAGIWFAAPARPPVTVAALWSEAGQRVYQNLSIPAP